MRSLAPALALLLCACSSRTALPDLPTLRLDSFHPTVRAGVEEALGKVKASPEDAGANGHLGMVLHAHDQLAAARVMYERARALDPNRLAWPYYLSVAENSLGHREAALAALDAASRIDPAYAPLRMRRAAILLDQGQLEQSAAIYGDLVKDTASSAAAWYGLGRARLAQGDAAGAVDPLRKACELYPAYGAAHYSLAQALRKLGREEEAARHLAQSEKHKTTVPAVDDRLMAELSQLNRGAGELLRSAKTAEEQGRIEEAESLTLQALELDPKSVQAHVNLISLYGRRGESDKAASHYEQALQLSPNHADAHYNYGVLLFQQKKWNEARSAFDKALEANPYFAAGHNNLGYILEMQGRPEEARKHYLLAIENEPGYRLAHFHLGRLLANRREYAGSIDHLKKTLTPEDHNTPGYLYALGAVYGRSGDRARSIEVMRQAREKAGALGQSGLVATIDRDLRMLGTR